MSENQRSNGFSDGYGHAEAQDHNLIPPSWTPDLSKASDDYAQGFREGEALYNGYGQQR